jgi:hypothetical protein
MNSRKRAIYLAGPMRGLPDFNYAVFDRAAEFLRGFGHQVYSPAEYPFSGPRDQFPLRQAFDAYCRFICRDACTIVLLPGWENSQGAVAELALARVCGLDVLHLEEDAF